MQKLTTTVVWIGTAQEAEAALNVEPTEKAVMTEKERTALDARVSKLTSECTRRRNAEAEQLQARLSELGGE